MPFLPNPFEIQSRKIDTGETMLTVLGEIDMATAPQLAKALARCKGRTVVDLRKVPFMDSSGIRVLVAEQQRLDRNGGSLRLLSGRGQVTRILDLTGIADTLQIDDSVHPTRAEEPSVGA
jgi:stage II sporulation protein AA (anti-sigma F factor antagonist)